MDDTGYDQAYVWVRLYVHQGNTAQQYEIMSGLHKTTK